jgi:hypothetical protein
MGLGNKGKKKDGAAKKKARRSGEEEDEEEKKEIGCSIHTYNFFFFLHFFKNSSMFFKNSGCSFEHLEQQVAPPLVRLKCQNNSYI